MDRPTSPSAPSRPAEPTHTDLRWKGRGAPFSGTPTSPGRGLPFTAPSSSAHGLPIPSPLRSTPIGEWWNSDVLAVEEESIKYGGGPTVSDAYTINGLPGPLYPSCSINRDTFIQTVEPGKTYMLRVINAALNDELFFAIDGHNLTVVEADATYVKPFSTPAIMITPGQTTTVLLTTRCTAPARQSFALAARPYVTATQAPFDNSTAVGFIHYSKSIPPVSSLPRTLPRNLPRLRDTAFATDFSNKLRSLASAEFPCKVPKEVDKEVFLTVSLNLQDCCGNCTCKGPDSKRFAASLNNQSFVRPPISILQSYYSKNGTLLEDFPERPTNPFDYTAKTAPGTNMNAEHGTRLLAVAYGTRMEVVLQDTSFINADNHPIHVHGHNFFVVGRGFGNFERERDRTGYNLEDPQERNTVAVPSGGWAAIRLTADNPGVWFVHCHLEVHTMWGLGVGFVVEGGADESQSNLPPPDDLPKC
ncbi:laccase-1 [Elaeis guineensis]|uniref:laccase-1 n=1 Tax=Elaeis guineensis var. tenera TaxID=51953 RepID=UPI003C6D6A3D